MNAPSPWIPVDRLGLLCTESIGDECGAPAVVMHRKDTARAACVAHIPREGRALDADTELALLRNLERAVRYFENVEHADWHAVSDALRDLEIAKGMNARNASNGPAGRGRRARTKRGRS